LKSRIAAAEARCGPKQTTNDERTARDLQIRHEEAGGAILESGGLALDSANAHEPLENAFLKMIGFGQARQRRVPGSSSPELLGNAGATLGAVRAMDD
jgi:hypothetical protein